MAGGTPFGAVAGRYDEARPGYPPEIADAIVAYHGGVPASVAEIGAGTGKGTEVLDRIGAPLICVEPDARMAAVLAARFPHARVDVAGFEEWTPPAGGAGVLACAMAWHWLDPATRNGRARHALAPGGTLAIFGHRYGYADAALGDAISAALRSVDPAVRERPVDWFHADVLAHREFTDVRKEIFRRELPLGRARFLALVSTFGPFLSRPPEQRRQALAALDRLVDDAGGTVVLDLRTTLVLGTG
ncbi:class I SAM-dependent methyltransferase [Catenuloplanes atrovinosus]|uniref:Methyltransferase type 11 domain-containing protein n=1 Tax=Catenuloplanes atrovinosus TaxID=137266 RepID=A0AAE4C981_9ACTN|nr:methyltransferase domain-containing protein [Catenuloplanes atrovinosus]MDR7276281.1 hypothetical protein [Catenuloplanes atrovinosus]